MRARLLHLRQELLPVGVVAHGRSAAGGRPDRSDQRPDDEAAAADAVGEALQVVGARVDAGVRFGEEEIDAVEPDAVHLGRGSQVEHRLEVDRRLAVGAFADEARPHRIVQGWIRVRHVLILVSYRLPASSWRLVFGRLSAFSFQLSALTGSRKLVADAGQRTATGDANRHDTTWATTVASAGDAARRVSLRQTPIRVARAGKAQGHACLPRFRPSAAAAPRRARQPPGDSPCETARTTVAGRRRPWIITAMVERETFNGRRAVVVENAALRVTVLEGGGHIASVLDKASGVSPLWIPPWPSIEPSAYGPGHHAVYGSGAEGAAARRHHGTQPVPRHVRRSVGGGGGRRADRARRRVGRLVPLRGIAALS